MDKILGEYAEIRAQIKDLEEKENGLKEVILLGLEDAEEGKIETSFGKFIRAVRKSYTYSPKVTTLEEKVKLAKIKEVEKGTAELKETAYLLFKENN